MAATVLADGTDLRYRPQARAMHAYLVLILLFGTLTLVPHDDRFIKWKPTVL
ncbi:septation protein IspZ [Candidatus Aalborgicola defluviihabitans]|uniref:septation protein IspZ n=1 Tax=Candidatus Aalborgicola defluviihabitans TaxID=3386187 RepID=UPI0039B85B44